MLNRQIKNKQMRTKIPICLKTQKANLGQAGGSDLAHKLLVRYARKYAAKHFIPPVSSSLSGTVIRCCLAQHLPSPGRIPTLDAAPNIFNIVIEFIGHPSHQTDRTELTELRGITLQGLYHIMNRNHQAEVTGAITNTYMTFIIGCLELLVCSFPRYDSKNFTSAFRRRCFLIKWCFNMLRLFK